MLGYCEKGLECSGAHVRECPDFAESGTCKIKGCKLPHVIRANRNRKQEPEKEEEKKEDLEEKIDVADAKLGDEYISLTFNESESESEEESEEEDEDEEEDDGDVVVHA